MSEKKRILCYFDYVCHTGFGVVAQAILRRLDDTNKYDFDIIGINYTGESYDREMWRGNVSPALVALRREWSTDLYGRRHLVDVITKSDDYDIIFIIQDTFIVQTAIDPILEVIARKAKKPKIVYYFPIDAPPKPSWVETVKKADYPVAYTHYAKNECVKLDPSLANKIDVIYHGHDFTGIYPLEEDLTPFRHMYFQGYVNKDTFLILNVSRNQARKDIVRSFMILKELKNRGHRNLHLYMHMAQIDVGGDIAEMATNFGFEFGKDWSCPADFSPQTGVDRDILNKLYNASDLFLTTALGEGFGIPPIEALSAKLPVVAPDNTVFPELYADNRAFLVPAGDTSSAWIMKENDNERLRPLMNVEKAADAIERVMAGEKPDVEGAYRWVKQLDWDIIALQWDKLFSGIQADYTNQKMPVMQLSRAERRRQERERKKLEKKGTYPAHNKKSLLSV
jgi:glycosyltransferase involved in cell wall biosynthesis